MIRHSEENSGGKMTSVPRESFSHLIEERKKKEKRRKKGIRNSLPPSPSLPFSLSLSLPRYHSRLIALCPSVIRRIRAAAANCEILTAATIGREREYR